MRPTGCSETCVRNYHYSLRKAQRSAVCIYILFTFYEELDTRVHIPYMLNLSYITLMYLVVAVSVVAGLITAFRTECEGTRAVRKIPELFQ